MNTLGAILFRDTIMLVGLLAAGIPVLLHLLNRIRSPIVPFPTLRFLKITAQKTSRRRQLQQWFLLLLRMAVFALIAMAVAQPLIRGGSVSLAYGFIGLLLTGLAFLVLAAVWINTALEQRSLPTPAASEIIPRPNATPTPRPSPTKYWGLSAISLLLGLAVGGYALFALVSDHYFSSNIGKYNGSSTACAIIYDNSHSMLARQDSLSRLQKAKEQIRLLLSGDIKPAQAAILPTNPGLLPVPDHLSTDTTATLGYLDKLEPLGRARPMRHLVRQALTMLAASSEPNRMLVIVSDLARPNFTDAEVFSALGDFPDLKSLQIVLMPQSAGSPPADVGIASFTVASGQPVMGNEIIFESQIINNGDAADVKDLQLLVDDKPVPAIQPRVQLGAAGTGSARTTIKIAYRLTAPGSQRFTLQLKDQTDAMQWDNQRHLVLNVANQVQVLVIGPQDTLRPRTTAQFVDVALDPYRGLAGKPTGGAGAPLGNAVWSIVPTYKSVTAAASQSLNSYAAVFMCDVPQISNELADALAKYANAGGRVVWLLGPAVDANNYNAQLARNRNLLPAELAAPLVTAGGSNVDWVDQTSTIFLNLFDNQEPFRQIVVTGRWGMPDNTPKRGRALSKLADNSVFMTQHLLGKGEVYTLLSCPSANWSNMATQVAFLPMLNRMALGDSGRLNSETAFEPGNQVLLRVPSEDPNLALDVVTPQKQTLNVRAVTGGDKPSWSFLQTMHEGLYHWQSVDKRFTGQFIVNPPAEEVDLLPTDIEALAKEAEAKTPRPVIVAPTVAQISEQLDKQATGTSLAPGVLALVIIMVLLEALLANRYKPALRTATVSSSSDDPSQPARNAA